MKRSMSTSFEPLIIEGDMFRDERGMVSFVNDFDMSRVVRMYKIECCPGVIRAWQGHRIETKWFFVARGSFLVKTMNIKHKARKEYQLNSAVPRVLCIPGGHYNGFVALEAVSMLLVYSDVNLVASKADDLRESIDTIPW